jgi:hypothetical protein
LNWSQAGEQTMFGPKLVQEAEEKWVLLERICGQLRWGKRATMTKLELPESSKLVIMYTWRYLQPRACNALEWKGN